jgi:hypothetical protein
MCQCGCGDFGYDMALRLNRQSVLSLDIYQGCADCHDGIALIMSFFNSQGVKDWLDGAKIEKAPLPDEYGGNHGHGVVLPILEVGDLIASLDELPKMKGYRSLKEWLEDNGLTLLQTALRRRRNFGELYT